MTAGRTIRGLRRRLRGGALPGWPVRLARGRRGTPDSPARRRSRSACCGARCRCGLRLRRRARPRSLDARDARRRHRSSSRSSASGPADTPRPRRTGADSPCCFAVGSAHGARGRLRVRAPLHAGRGSGRAARARHLPRYRPSCSISSSRCRCMRSCPRPPADGGDAIRRRRWSSLSTASGQARLPTASFLRIRGFASRTV